MHAFYAVAACVLLCGAQEPDIAKRAAAAKAWGDDLLRDDAWRPWGEGFAREGNTLVCDNAGAAGAQRGASQTVVLDQTAPAPIRAVAWSRAENVGGGPDSDYSLYLDLLYADGTPLWGQTAAFSAGSHDWERREVVVFPDKPVKSLSFHLLLRRHSGKAFFRDPELRQAAAPEGFISFDGVPVTLAGPAREGLQLRDVAGGSDFVRAGTGTTLGVAVTVAEESTGGARIADVVLRDTTGKDRALTLVYAVPFDAAEWLADPRRREKIERPREYADASRFAAGANGRLSRYPFGAAANAARGLALGLDPEHPVFFRVGFNSGAGELFLACDIGLAPEKNEARVRIVRFEFAPAWGFRAALAEYYRLFPNAFRSRTPVQGVWMPFAKISAVKGWEDFGFAFKEGNNETQWDDAHGIITFRYTEPMTWWMPMPKHLPRTLAAAAAEAERLAREGAPNLRSQARSLLASGYHDAHGKLIARLLDTPWCDGAVWSMNSMPGIAGEATDFNLKWNPSVKESLYGPGRKGDLDGEYIDSSEGYVTGELDFRRAHFAAARTPLVFATDTRAPAIFRGLIAFEYARAIAADVHGMGKLMMANATPDRLFWLAPLLDVMGTETNWNPGGAWRPMRDADLLYRRAVCGPKPFCFLMNTDFDAFGPDRVERYMRRCLAYGMFPGFFSADASTGHYFSRPELYERDRPLFKTYVPLCKLLAEAGWEPITNARSSVPHVHVERFGERRSDGRVQAETVLALGPEETAVIELR
ncbi:MAG TPA: hypothetical protein DCM87_07870 [Planctomycetes bacterium]|nr:hypothetical protein [Planctomycetota bacterium]